MLLEPKERRRQFSPSLLFLFHPQETTMSNQEIELPMNPQTGNIREAAETKRRDLKRPPTGEARA